MQEPVRAQQLPTLDTFTTEIIGDSVLPTEAE